MTSERTTLLVRDAAERSRFEAVDAGGAVAGFSDYVRYDDRIVFTHTEVDPAFEGRGIGSQLVRQALDAVRATDLRVVATCPFVKAWIARHPSYDDLLHR